MSVTQCWIKVGRCSKISLRGIITSFIDPFITASIRPGLTPSFELPPPPLSSHKSHPMYDDKPIIIRKATKEQGPKKIVSLDDKELKLVPRSVSETIKKGREKLIMTQKELAMKMGKKVAIISEWENGKAHFDEKLAKKFEEVLNVKFEK